MRLSFTLLLLIFSVGTVFSQKNVTTKSTRLILSKAKMFQQDEEYQDAIEWYDKVNINDTSYAAAQLEIGNCYMSMSDFKKAREVFRNILADDVKYDEKNEVYSSLGVSYLREGDSLSAYQLFTEAIEKFPMDYKLYYNRGITAKKLKNYQGAYDDFQAAIQRNIYSGNAHYNLAMMAANEGNYAEALMGFMTYLLVESSTAENMYVYSLMQKLADGSFEPESVGFDVPNGEVFENVNLLIKNKVALDSKYKVKFTIDTEIARQLHFILTNVNADPESENYWVQTYLTLYQKINTDGKLNDLMLLCDAYSPNTKIRTKAEKNINKIKNFIPYLKDTYYNVYSNQYFDYEGKEKKVFLNYENSRLSYFGPLDDDQKANGNFYYYHPNGALMLKAQYEHGDPVGTYELYNATNDKMFKKITFIGPKEKTEEFFYYTGELKEKDYLIDGVLQDTVYYYYRNGTVKEVIPVKDGKKNGHNIEYYENGSISYEADYKDGLGAGKVKNYYANGKLYSEMTFVDDVLEGEKNYYYANGQLSRKENYVKGKLNGAYEEYYPDGKLSEKGTYKNNNYIGEYKTYYTNGNLSSSIIFGENGKENGTYELFDLDGLKYHEIDYSSGNVKEVRFFDKKGTKKVIATEKSKKLDYKLFYPDGILKISGLYDNGQRSGKWNYFDRYGNLTKTENYVKGIVQDSMKTFYSNGQVHEMAMYEDGYLNGLYLEYNEYGDLIEEGFYKDDEPDRERYTYRADGSLSAVLYYVNGTQHGIQQYFTIHEKLLNEEEYEFGQIIQHTFFDTTEQIISKFNEYDGWIELKDPLNQFVSYKGHYANGANDGDFFYYLPDHKLKEEGKYINDMRTGEWKWYDNNGKLYGTMSYVNGRKDGADKDFYPNGKLEYTANYVFGSKEGPFNFYYVNGKVRLSGNYLDDERHGSVKMYTSDGSLILIRNYNQGVIESYSYLGRDGKPIADIPVEKEADSIISYHQNGNVAMRSYRVNGNLEGEYFVYYANGKVYEHEFYKYDNKHGLSQSYHENGQLEVEVNYEKGYKNGVEKTYYSNGKLKSEQQFVFGVEHGDLKEYDQNGKLITITTYYDGNIIKIQRF